MKLIRPPAKAQIKQVTLGFKAFTKISAIEGVRLSDDSRRMFVEFEKRGLTPQERRKAIVAKHAKKA